MLKKMDPKVSGKIQDGGGALSKSREGGTRRNFGWKQRSSYVEGKLLQREVSRRLNVSENTLQNWLKAHRQGELAEVGKTECRANGSRKNPGCNGKFWRRISGPGNHIAPSACMTT